MAERRHILPRGRQLALPARDILRGAYAIVRKATSRLEPLGGRLPSPLRGMAKDMSSALGGFAQQARDLAYSTGAEMRRGNGGSKDRSAELAVIMDRDDAAALFAKTFARGLSYGFERLNSDRYIVSEVLSANTYRSVARKVDAPDDPYERAAQLFLALDRNQAVGIAPGTGIGMGPADSGPVAIASFAVLLWMLVERDAPRDNEDEILAICVDVSVSLEQEISEASEDEAELARLFSAYVSAI